MSDSYDLSQLDSNSFEHLVNFLALKVLGKGVTGFARGADGGRDGYLVGEAPYPTESERWRGSWYIQSKFHKPHLSKNPQAWLVNEVKKELESYSKSESRVVPDIWIIATNIEPSGNIKTGSYDAVKELVEEHFGVGYKVDIWGGRKILDFLAQDPNAASYYGHFLTPGNVLTTVYNQVGDASAQVKSIINNLILDQFNDQIYTKLEQAGSLGVRPKINELFVDLPVECNFHSELADVMETLVATSANVHKATVWNSFGDGWRDWSTVPKRARVILLKGGPGQGKSTAGQFYAQVQRAALLLEPHAPIVMPDILEVARDFVKTADGLNFLPVNARIPVSVELKDFASWFGARSSSESRGVITYLCEKISLKIDQKVEGGTLKRAIASRGWFFNFDGLDEVPNDVKDDIANEIIRFSNLVLPELDADALILCTTRPQGYSGQFENLNASVLELSSLSPSVAMKCAEGVLKFGRSATESAGSIEVLQSAMESAQVRELMTTPLQSHIMAVVVRDGGRPPEKRWELFDNFYQVMKKRESLKNFPDIRISKFLRENTILLKAIHSRLGITLHASAETSNGADTTLKREQFCELARQTTKLYVEKNVDELVDTLMEATVERLVFVNTPESSTTLRFDIRQLQEFFAGEFIYSNIDPLVLRSRLEVIGADSHWREVMHFVISALVVNMRPTELSVALQVICKIDDSDVSHYARVLRRRMGVGAILALRLLCEGVLEQDRSVRMKFKESLVPLYAMTDINVLSHVATMSHEASLEWLLNCMIDALFEYSEPEQIGAAVGLVMRLPDSHERVGEVKSKLFGASNQYLNRVFRTYLSYNISNYRGRQELVSSSWFLEGIVSLFASDTLGDIDVMVILRILRQNENIQSRFAHLGMQKDEVELFSLLFEIEVPGQEVERDLIKLDCITLVKNVHSWQSKTIPKQITNTGEKIFVGGSPILNMLSAVMRFIRTQRIDDLLIILRTHVKYDLNEGFLASHIHPLLPIKFDDEPMRSQLKFYNGVTQEELDRLLSGGSSPVYKMPSVFSIVDIGTVDSWERANELSKYHCEVALSFFMPPAYYCDVDIFYADEEKRLGVFELIKNNIHVMYYHFSVWGYVFEKLDKYAAELRELLVINALNEQLHIDALAVYPFVVSLPSENNFLPLLANFIPQNLGRNILGLEESSSVSDVLSLYGLDSKALEAVYQDESNSDLIRAAAFGCYVCHARESDSEVALEFFTRKLDDVVIYFAELQVPDWYVSCLVYAFEYFDLNDRKVVDFAGRIIHTYRENYNARSILNILLSKWRERSSAPVQSRAVLEHWLKE
ncbi:hypothetical protein J1G35_14900 [Pseudomonas sp. SH10-3B]|uniref:NACHT domain-containing protein n=1 Tax=Pseudomonas sp. SH10-3B TaxID=2816049 RepID=UPI001CA717AD|nr:hypothetical protein [Pseudomonas sp. SH10-3B]MBY8947150.1 hypothetical protein [Pseudomonas sp. SH10-3B]